MEKFQPNENAPNEQEQTGIWRDKIIEQIVEIRDSGLTNMFALANVFELAVEKDFYELADFIFTDSRGYSKFILHGDRAQLIKPSS